MTNVGAIPRVVPVLDRCPEVTASLQETLSDTPYELVPLPSWSQVDRLGPGVAMYIATAPDADVFETDREFLISRMKRDGLPVVLVHGGVERNPGAADQDDHRSSLAEDLRGPFLPDGSSVLSVALGESWWVGRVRQMIRRVDGAASISLPTRAAIKWTLRLRVPELSEQAEVATSARGGARQHPWSVSVAAAATGISRGHLTCRALEDQWRIRSGADKWIAVQTVYLSNLYEEGLLRLALRLGYADASGLTRLFERSLGYPPSALPTWDGEYWLRWFEAGVLGVVVA